VWHSTSRRRLLLDRDPDPQPFQRGANLFGFLLRRRILNQLVSRRDPFFWIYKVWLAAHRIYERLLQHCVACVVPHIDLVRRPRCRWHCVRPHATRMEPPVYAREPRSTSKRQRKVTNSQTHIIFGDRSAFIWQFQRALFTVT